ncbi:hypothetical protein [Colwellia psychrerythraea]|uniref:Uncharacterized protein n=1 Tax=Colwellia psychrerythraea TaxID=28229 RepID=A0A099K6F4_COLPS|nr:hypothetical protein [Colwellia psychrerythraea]KGJ86394.1 hypothetical protein ND2E_0960 [Colwellia psychrerythraea]
MGSIEKAIEAAYQAHISSLYKVLSKSLLSAKGDASEVAAAESRFKKGLEFAADVQSKARAVAGL